MDRHCRYTLLLVGSMVALTLGFGLWARGFEPLWGDLTRIGWRSENAYGWTEPKLHFEPLAAEIGRLDRHYDIVAIGDSFTGESIWRPGTTWPHFLAHDTGLSVGIFDSDDDLIDRLIASPGFQVDPPEVVIYEIVERNFIPGHPSAPGEACPVEMESPHPVLAAKPPTAPPLPDRRLTTRPWTDLPISYGLAWLIQNARRAVIGHETTNSVALNLTRSGLFSSRNDRSLLVYGEDFNKVGWVEQQWRDAACNLLRLQQRVQTNGHTLFLAMVAPDKLTSYGPWLEDESFRRLSRLDLLAEYSALHLVRIDRENFDPAAQIDLYLPDDTHWSTTGHALAAELVEQRLRTLGVLPAVTAAP
ncbi:MAG: hypothetical protein WCC64_13815 [Aliidongia sp.]